MKAFIVLVAIFIVAIVSAMVCWILYAFRHKGQGSKVLFWTLVLGAGVSIALGILGLITLLNEL